MHYINPLFAEIFHDELELAYAEGKEEGFAKGILQGKAEVLAESTAEGSIKEIVQKILKLKAEGKAEGIAEGAQKTLIANIRAVMKNLHFTATQAMDALRVSADKQKEYADLI